jgi:transcription termination factor NusB
MGLFKKKEAPIVLQPPVQPVPTTQQQQVEIKKETNELMEQRRFEILEEKTATLKERTDHLSTAIKLREETLTNILELMKTVKEKQDKLDKTIEKIETFLKANADDYK